MKPRARFFKGLLLTSLLLAPLGLNACGLLNSMGDTEEEPEMLTDKKAEVSSESNGQDGAAIIDLSDAHKAADDEKAPTAPKTRNSKSIASVEVTWQAPAEPVEVYHLHYGTQKSNLSKHVKIPIAELKKFDHPIYGPVFSYHLNNVPRKSAIYVSIQAENRHGTSPPSKPVKVESK